MNSDLRKLDDFVAVAEERNFTRAAERLRMTQQALSTSIRQLERELGVTLLERSARHVALTDAGRALLETGRPVLAGARAAWDRTRRVGRGEMPVLRVGRTPAATGEEASELLTALRRREPDAQISVEQHWPADLGPTLLRGELDVASAGR